MTMGSALDRSRRSSRRAFLALALGTVALDCKPNAGPGYPPHATISKVRSNVIFSPDGESLAVMQLARVSLYDLGRRAVRWAHPVTRDEVGVTFSPSGTFVLILEVERAAGSNEEQAASPKTVTVRRADTGAPVLAKVRSLGWAQVESVARTFAVSDDGAFVAWEGSMTGLEIWSTADSSVAYRDPSCDRGDKVLAFEPRTHRLAEAGCSRVRVTDRVNGTWKPIETFEGASDPKWTSAGLFFAYDAAFPHAIQRWDGAVRPLLVGDPALPGQGLDRSIPNWWMVSPDGVYVASWLDSSVSVWRVGAAPPTAPLFTQSSTFERGGLVWLAAFAPGHFRAFLRNGTFLDFEIPSGNIVRKTFFGEVSTSSKSLFTDGVHQSLYYRPALGPTGKYVAIEAGDAEIYLTE